MSCIDLIFCTNQSVISNHGVDVSIFDKCHHNIIYGKINICVPLPPIYVREVWDYIKANIENIKKAISTFDWNKAFENLSIDEKFQILNKTLLNIFRNYIKNYFEQSLKKGKFLEIWEKANLVPVHKKEDKMLVKNYRSISLLPSFWINV